MCAAIGKLHFNDVIKAREHNRNGCVWFTENKNAHTTSALADNKKMMMTTTTKTATAPKIQKFPTTPKPAAAAA